MPVSCSRCNKVFKFPYLLDKHYDRKKPCKRVVETALSKTIQNYPKLSKTIQNYPMTLIH